MAEHSEEDLLRGVLPVTVAGQSIELPILKRVHSRGWKQKVAEELKGIVLQDLVEGEAVAKLANVSSDVVFELVLAYDRGSVLGGRKKLNDGATDVEIFGLFRAMLEVSYPELKAAWSAAGPMAMPIVRQLVAEVLAGRSARSSSPNGRSTSGASTEELSTVASPTSN